ncbi:hypothetical protein RHSIM_Rhsim08G0115500 [Rhododendron simsii]|uniref:Late embryogenesis abundant protein n=1 Tax=Rhododendron simsii TaxID=118357 RepID=A0A834GL69_RHOSS|nr:hypothetical protein RHSIM_Rhsim08G0115500 [Rhododendron simsii]
MLNTVRSIRTQSPTLFSSPQFPYQIRRNTSGLSFKQPPAAATAANNHNDMDQQQQTNKRNTKTGDVTSHSFGEGYATRCDEEGFGGIYGGNDPLSSEEKTPSKIIHESHPEYDKTQGSEVAEKEKARHQKTAES